jgi:AcrR family transcriptional regulator
MATASSPPAGRDRPNDRPAEKSLRKDAEANRQRLLDAAGAVFAERGLSATLHEVAARAGVGVGTAYRNFSNKGELINEVFERRLDEVVAHAKEALLEADAWRGLTSFLEHSLRMQYEDRGVKDMLTNPSLGAHLVGAARDRIAPLVDAMVARARDEGSLRPDFESTDLIFLQVALAALMDGGVRAASPALYQRYLAIFLDGIRTDRSLSPLPVEALSVDRTHSVMVGRVTT